LSLEINKIHLLDCLTAMQQLEDNSIDCIITSPPYNKKGLQGKKKIRSPEEVEASSVRALFKRLEESLSDEEFTEFLTEEQFRDIIYWLNDFESDNDGGNCSPSFVKFTQGRLEEFDDIVAKIRESISTRYKYHRKGNSVWGGFEIDYDSYSDFMPEKEYHRWMIAFLNECNRVIKSTGSIFFNHKPRRCKNQAHLPTDFIINSEPIIYQVVIWDRRSSPNIRNDVLIPCTERVYWLRKNEKKSKPSVYRNQVKKEFRGEVWKISVKKQKNHPAPFPPQLVENCILLSTQPGDIVLDPFMGCGTTAIVADELKRNWLGFEMDAEYIKSYYEEVGAREESNES
jgi:DNA modification methylase